MPRLWDAKAMLWRLCWGAFAETAFLGRVCWGARTALLGRLCLGGSSRAAMLGRLCWGALLVQLYLGDFTGLALSLE